jgi:hypothetical protein
MWKPFVAVVATLLVSPARPEDKPARATETERPVAGAPAEGAKPTPGAKKGKATGKGEGSRKRQATRSDRPAAAPAKGAPANDPAKPCVEVKPCPID